MASLDLFPDEIEEGRRKGHIIDVGNPAGIVCPHDIGVIGVDSTTTRALSPVGLNLFKSTITSPEPSLILGFGLGVEIADFLKKHPNSSLEGLSLTPVSPYRLVDLSGGRDSLFTERRDEPYFKQWIGDCQIFLNSTRVSGKKYRFIYDNNGPLYHMGITDLMDGVGSILTDDGALFCVALGVSLPEASLERGQMAYWYLGGNSIIVLGSAHPLRDDADEICRESAYRNIKEIINEENWLDLIDLFRDSATRALSNAPVGA